jgi:hypothetical protein
MSKHFRYGRELIRTDGKKECFVKFRAHGGLALVWHVYRNTKSGTWCSTLLQWFGPSAEGHVIDHVRHEDTWPIDTCLQCKESYQKIALLASAKVK